MNDDYTVLINKENHLSSFLVPDDLVSFDSKYLEGLACLRKEAFIAFSKLQMEVKKLGYELDTCSAYRDYNEQVATMNEFVLKLGEEMARRRVSLPNCSEHLTGLAIDIVFWNKDEVIEGFDLDETIPCYTWFLNNIAKYGYILRYPKGKEDITGVMYEPWHIRYVGIDLANYLYETQETLEEYYCKKKSKRLI